MEDCLICVSPLFVGMMLVNIIIYFMIAVPNKITEVDPGTIGSLLGTALLTPLRQECGQSNCHPTSAKLGSFSGKNNSRDFWKCCSVPIESWLQNHAIECAKQKYIYIYAYIILINKAGII